MKDQCISNANYEYYQVLSLNAIAKQFTQSKR